MPPKDIPALRESLDGTDFNAIRAGMVALRKLKPHSTDARNATADLAETAASNRAAVPSGDTTIQRLPNGRYRVHDPTTGEEIGQAPNRSAAVRMAQLAAENANPRPDPSEDLVSSETAPATNEGSITPDLGATPLPEASGDQLNSEQEPITAKENQAEEEDDTSTTTWQRHPRFQRPAPRQGQFSGEEGNSPFALSDVKADEMGVPRGTSIPWIRGIPDFGAHAVAGPNGSPGTYEVPDLTGNHDADRALIIPHLATLNGMSPREIKAWLKRNKIRLHHSGGNSVQNVPKNIHDLHHSGGTLELREEQ